MEYKIKLNNLKKYLESKGWIISSFNDKFYKITKSLENENFEMVIPKVDNIPEYNYRIKDIIESLSAIEDRDFDSVYEDISSVGYDLMKIRFKSERTEEGTIPLIDFASAINDVKDIITYGVCSEIYPKSQYTRPFEEATDLVNNCQFAQTAIGSFVAVIKIPLGETYIPTFDEDEEYLKDLGRRSIVRLINGINDVQNINLDDEINFRETYDNKLNKNICKAISHLKLEENNFNMEFIAKWDSTRPPVEALPQLTEIRPDATFRKFGQMEVYLTRIPEERALTIIGKIIKMQHSDEEGIVSENRLIHIHVPLLKRNIRLLLNEIDYPIACDAHRDVINAEIRGILNKRNGHWYLDGYENFRIIRN